MNAQPVDVLAARYFAHDGDVLKTYDTLDKARASAEEALQFYIDHASEGWNDNSLNICYGIVLGEVRITETRDATPEDVCYPDCQVFEERELVDLCAASTDFDDVAVAELIAALAHRKGGGE